MMTHPFNTHLDSCSPLEPCLNCHAAAFLRSKLQPAQYEEFCSLFNASDKRVPSDLTQLGLSISQFERAPSATLNRLIKAGITTIGDLIVKTKRELELLDGVGKKGISHIERDLADRGLSLGMTLPAKH